MNRCLQEAHLPEWMIKGKTIFIQKDPLKGTAPNNYRLITCLPMMWKIQSVQIREGIYYSLTSHGLFPEEHKGSWKGYRDTEEQLYIDQHILNESKTSRKNLAMAWIDNKSSEEGYYFISNWYSLKKWADGQMLLLPLIFHWVTLQNGEWNF